MKQVSRTIRIAPLILTALAASIYTEPVQAQEFLGAFAEFDVDSDNRKVPNKLEAWITIPRRGGSWLFCVYGRNTAGKKGTFSFTLTAWDTRPGTPYVFTGNSEEVKGKAKLASSGSTAYGETCYTLTFGATSGTTHAIYRLQIQTKATGKLSLDNLRYLGHLRAREHS